MSLNHSPELLTSWFQKIFFIIFYESMGANDPPDVAAANLNPRGMAGRIYVVNHYTLLHTKYRSSCCGLHGFRRCLKLFPHYKSREANGPQGMDNFAHSSIVGKIYVRDHQTLIYTKYISYGPHEENILKSFSHYKSIGAIDPQEHGRFAPKGFDWQDLCSGPLDIATY